jgi:hypothetical protein
MKLWLLVEATVAIIVFCADSVGDDPRRPAWERVMRGVCWPITVSRWFTHRNTSKLARFGAIVWLLVTMGWLLSLERDRIRSATAFFAAAEVTLAFIVYCVDSMSPDFARKRVRRLLHCVVWVTALGEYLRDEDSIRLLQASVTTWVLLTSGWLIGLEVDRIARPLGWLAR